MGTVVRIGGEAHVSTITHSNALVTTSTGGVGVLQSYTVPAGHYLVGKAYMFAGGEGTSAKTSTLIIGAAYGGSGTQQVTHIISVSASGGTISKHVDFIAGPGAIVSTLIERQGGGGSGAGTTTHHCSFVGTLFST